MLLDKLIDGEKIIFAERANDWQAAIRLAAEPLLKCGSIEKRYVDAMINSVEENGPYIVIDEGLALPHARPEDGVNRLDMSFLILRDAVDLLGNDVKVFALLAAADSGSHLEALKDLANTVWALGSAQPLAEAKSPDEVIDIIKSCQGE